MKYELKARQVCFFIIAFLPVTKFFSLSCVLATCAKEDMWLSGAFSLFIDFITIATLTFFCKNERRDFFTILEDGLGKVGKNAVLIFYCAFFLLKSAVPVVEQKDFIESTLYLNMPNIVYFLPFFVFAFFLATKRLRALGRSADALFLITLSGSLIILVLSTLGADFSALLPVGANGIGNVLLGSYQTFGWFSDGAYFLFFIGNYGVKKGDVKKILLSFLLYAVIVIFFLMVFYGVFSYTAFREKFPLTEMPSYSTVISSVGRFDYLGIVFILCSSLFSVSLPLFFASKILNEVFNIKKGYVAPLLVTGILLAVVLLSERFTHFIDILYTEYLPAAFLLFGNILPLFIPLLKRRKYELKKD